jgi:hypothetical protein
MNRGALKSVLLVLLFCIFPLLAFAEPERNLEVRHAVEVQPGRVRIFARFVERQNSVRYPISTLDTSAFRLRVSGDDGAPVPAVSLSTFGTLAPGPERGLLLGMEQTSELGKSARFVREGAAEFVGTLRSGFLSVISFHSKGVDVFAESIPGRTDNIKAIQKRLLDVNQISEKGSIAEGACSISAQFSAWREFMSDSSAQKAAVFIGHGGVLNSAAINRTVGCLGTAKAMGIQVYWLRVADNSQTALTGSQELAQVFLDGGGFLQEILPDTDFSSSLSNVRANLDDEYVAEFVLPASARKSSDLRYSLLASYHGNVVVAPENVVKIVALEEPKALAPMGRSQINWLNLLVGLIAILSIVLLIVSFFIWRHARRYRMCDVCGHEVRRDFSDCAFRSAKCLGRLVVVSGTDSGRIFPLFEGDNFIGSAADCGVRLAASAVVGKHSKLTLFKKKALYQVMEGKGDRINGWPLSEPRLLGSGANIRLGNAALRFESKE